MGLKNTTHIILSLIFLGTITFTSCTQENTEGGVYCFDCMSSAPDSSDLVVKVTLNSENKSVPIVIYNDKYNPNNEMKVYKIDTVSVPKYTITVPTDSYYSVKAEYKSGSKTINAIDGGFFDAQKQQACDNTCWHVVGGNYDVQLKSY